MEQSNKLIKQEYQLTTPLDNISIDADILAKIQNFQKSYLHKPVDPKEIKKNKFANNSQYLPISFLEMTLDEIFFGLWQTKNFNTKVIANEIAGELELWYFHPTAKTWLCRIGAGAVQIQFRSPEKGGSGDITNIGDKIQNTLTKDYPHLKAECFRNACLSLGKSFGRDLNREFEDQYKPVIPNVKPVADVDVKSKELIDLIDSLPEDGLKEMYRSDCMKAKQDKKYDIQFVEKKIQEVKKDLGK